jgi:hypothetical protein
MAKIPISVIALYYGEGIILPHKIPTSSKLLAKYKVIPLRILYQDTTIIVDRITDIRREASTKAGGLGERYTCLATRGDVQMTIYVYKDEDEWYMEEYFGF